MLNRLPYLNIWKDLSAQKPMVFLAGPRQSGKTTFSRLIASTFTNSVYFNWDLITHKKLLTGNPTFFEQVNRKDPSTPLVIFDEIHKYRKWKNYLKGVYDQFSDQCRFLVLGSGRLNIFQKGGDSLAGRYFLFTLWPLTLAELAKCRRPFEAFKNDPLRADKEDPSLESLWTDLSNLSGFPEPYLSGKATVYRRWARNYQQQLIREDIRNLTAIKELDSIELLFSLIPSKIGYPLSQASLARDLQVSFNSIRHWLAVFETFFLTFSLSPWTKKISRAITKEKKVYLYDYGRIPFPAAKFENMVALELLRAISNWNDLGLGDFELHYVRNKEKEEVDFLVTNDHIPQLLVETKLSDEQVSKSLLKFQTLLNVPAIQLVNQPGVYKLVTNPHHQILVITASRYLPTLP